MQVSPEFVHCTSTIGTCMYKLKAMSLMRCGEFILVIHKTDELLRLVANGRGRGVISVAEFPVQKYSETGPRVEDDWSSRSKMKWEWCPFEIEILVLQVFNSDFYGYIRKEWKGVKNWPVCQHLSDWPPVKRAASSRTILKWSMLFRLVPLVAGGQY